MSKKKYFKGKVPALLFIFIAVIALFGMVSLGLVPQGLLGSIPGLECSGFTDLSLSKVDFKSTDPIMNGEVWALTVAQCGLGQKAHMITTIDKEKIADGGKFANSDVTLELDFAKQSCVYPVQIDNDAISPRRYLKGSTGPITGFFIDTKEECRKKYPGWTVYYADPMLVGGIFASYGCYMYKDVSSKPAILPSRPPVEYSAEFTVSTNEGVARANVSNKSGTVSLKTSSGRKIGYVTELGSLYTGNECPESGGMITIYMDGEWKMFSESKYEDWRRFIRDNDDELFYKDNIARPFHANTISEANKRLDIFLSSSKNLISAGGSVARTFGNEDAGGFKIDLVKPVRTPLFTVYLKADWVGIEQPVANPQIVAKDSACFKTGNTGLVQVEVLNSGDRGNIEAWISCPSGSGFSQSGSKMIQTLNTGEKKTFFIPVKATVATRTLQSCVITVQSLGNKKSATIQLCADPQAYCEPNEKFCEENFVKQCNAAGSGTNIITDCSKEFNNGVCKYNPNTETFFCEAEGGDGKKIVCTSPEVPAIKKTGCLGTFCIWEEEACIYPLPWDIIISVVVALILLVLLYLIGRNQKWW